MDLCNKLTLPQTLESIRFKEWSFIYLLNFIHFSPLTTLLPEIQLAIQPEIQLETLLRSPLFLFLPLLTLFWSVILPQVGLLPWLRIFRQCQDGPFVFDSIYVPSLSHQDVFLTQLIFASLDCIECWVLLGFLPTVQLPFPFRRFILTAFQDVSLSLLLVFWNFKVALWLVCSHIWEVRLFFWISFVLFPFLHSFVRSSSPVSQCRFLVSFRYSRYAWS